LFNLAGTPFDGELKIVHFATMPGRQTMAGTMTISPPLECRPAAPMVLPFECSARISLEAGESRTYDALVTFLTEDETTKHDALNCGAVTDTIFDVNKLLPGLPPAPMTGLGYDCRRFTLLSERSDTSADRAGSKSPEDSSRKKTIDCPQGLIEQGTQCVCPRQMLWDGRRCGLADERKERNAKCANGSPWDGVVCRALGKEIADLPDRLGPSVCKPPFRIGSKGCACPKGMKWTGLTCRPEVDFEKADTADVGSRKQAGTGADGAAAQKQEPCPENQVRDANGQCSCLPYLEAVIEGGKALCCLVPCPEGTTRVNTECVAEGKPGPPPLPPPPAIPASCERGMIGTPPNCACPDNMRFDGQLCVPIECPPGTEGLYPICEPIRCEGGMIGTPPNCACPDNMRFDGQRCLAIQCPAGTRGLYPDCDPIRCPPGMTGTPPNCACPANTRFDGQRCLAIQCPAGTRGLYPDCEPIRCPAGYVMDRRGNCVPDRAQTSCPPGTRALRRGTILRCVPIQCLPGHVMDRSGNCVPDRAQTPPSECPPGTRAFRRGTRLRCVPIQCPPGEVMNQRGNCVADRAQTTPSECPPGTRALRRGTRLRCVPIQCPPGYRVLVKPNKYGAYCEQTPVTQPRPHETTPNIRQRQYPSYRDRWRERRQRQPQQNQCQAQGMCGRWPNCCGYLPDCRGCVR
jgi:hypothetical protein